MTVVHVNGKFTAQRLTGAQRVAQNLLQAVDEHLAGRKAAGAAVPRWVLWCPPGAAAPALHCIEVRTVGSARLGLHAWEQFQLPRAAARGRLLNLSGSAPWFARRQVCVMFDAALFDAPEAYRPAFRLWYRALFRRLARRADALLTISAFSRDRLALHLGVAPGRFAVLPCGADHLDRCPADEGVLDRHDLRGRRFLLAVGSANPTKNHARLFEAFARLPESDLRLVLAGGRNDDVFSTQAPPTAADARVVHAGALDDASLKALYQHARGLVFPSLYEGFGLPPLEAMACGCPVVATRAAAVPEVCGDAVLYVDPLDVDSIAAAMRRLLDDPALCAQLRAAGRLRARGFRWATAAAELARVMDS